MMGRLQQFDALDLVHGKRCPCGYLLRSPREQEDGFCIECRIRVLSSPIPSCLPICPKARKDQQMSSNEPQEVTDIEREVEQGIAESLALGNIRMVSKDGQEDLMELTTKGVTRTSLLMVNVFIDYADREQRDFTSAEKHEIAGYLLTAINALQKNEMW
jgi:hypothetical protein